MNQTSWITKKSLATPKFTDGSILLRKVFNISLPIKTISVDVVGLGYGEFTVNGIKITDDVLTTPFTAFDKRVIYQTYDITDYVQVGKNVFGAFVGNGWYNDTASTWDFHKAAWRANPKLAAKITIEYMNGNIKIIKTDSSWKAADGPAIFNHLRQGEIYDARLEQTNWDTITFDDSAWENAVIVRSPGGILEPMNMPPIKVIRHITPISVTQNGIYDFGENISGWVKITAAAAKGTELIIKYGEHLDENGELHEHINEMTRNEGQPYHHENRYIFKGCGIEEYAPRFCYHGFRYVKLSNAPKDITIVAEVVHTDLKQIGSFWCSDEMLNKIHEASLRSTITNYHSIPTDCPHREQNGWTADAMLSAQQALFNLDIKSSYAKWMKDFKDVQRASGQLPGIVPTSGWGFEWGSGPAWDVAMILIPWYVYENTGDLSLIENMWENNEKYFEYMKNMSEDYIVCYGLGDWCPPPNCSLCPTVVTDTAYFYVYAITMSKCAELLRKDSTFYKKEAENIKKAWRDKFLPQPELRKSQTFLACAVYQGMLEESETKDFVKALAQLVVDNDYHIDCGILGTKYIFTALSEHGYSEILYKMITNPTMPSYAYWINNGLTTFCEMWQIARSYNHHMYSEVDHWFYKYLAGIQIFAEEIVIKPCFIEAVPCVKASHRGISVEYNENNLTLITDRECKVVLKNKTYTVGAGIYSFTLANNERAL